MRGADTTKPEPKGPVGSGPAPKAVVVAAAAAPGGDVNALLSANTCTACHGVKNKIVGPGFNEIAARYKSKSDAQTYLMGKIKSGGSGVWGSIPMPPQDQLKEADAKAIAQWIAEGAK